MTKKQLTQTNYDFLEALKQVIINDGHYGLLDWAKKTKCVDDQEFVRANGVYTGWVARHMNVSCYEARKNLNKLNLHGKVVKSLNNTNGAYWLPYNFLEDAKAGLYDKKESK